MLGVVTGLAAEARVARGLGPVAVGGGSPAGAEAAARRLVAQGATALLSFGLAGGLDPALRPGRLFVPAAVLEAGQAYPTDAAVLARFGLAAEGLLLAGDAVVADAAAKDALWRRTGAQAVDLESGAVALVAAAHGMAFAVVRALCDPAERTLPPAALLALDGGGAIGLWRVLRSVALAPWQVPALLALARDAGRAQRALARFAQANAQATVAAAPT